MSSPEPPPPHAFSIRPIKAEPSKALMRVFVTFGTSKTLRIDYRELVVHVMRCPGKAGALGRRRLGDLPGHIQRAASPEGQVVSERADDRIRIEPVAQKLGFVYASSATNTLAMSRLTRDSGPVDTTSPRRYSPLR